jgi:hypothetical protein
MFAQADTKYLWNRLLLEELIENKVSFYIKLGYLFHQLELIPKCTNSSDVQKLLQSDVFLTFRMMQSLPTICN